jgi:hypothetical protein
MTDERDPDAELDLELASAYLDGEVTAEERAVVEGDPALLIEVDRLRRLRDELAEARPAPAAARDAAIAAAMTVFDESPGNVVDLAAARRRTRWIQGLSAAAAVAIVAAGAVVIATRNGDEGDVADENAAVPATTAAQMTSGAARDTQATATETDESAGAAAAQTAAEFQATTTTTAPAAAAAPAVAPTTAPVAADAADEVVAEAPPVLRAADDLAEIADDVDPTPPSLDVIVDECENARLLPDAIYLTDEGEEIEVVVARTADGYAAVSLDDCAVVLETPA